MIIYVRVLVVAEKEQIGHISSILSSRHRHHHHHQQRQTSAMFPQIAGISPLPWIKGNCRPTLLVVDIVVVVFIVGRMV